MKAFFNRNIKILFIFVISGILFTGVGVYATTQFLAKDISFTPTNENFTATNVEDALNELYTYYNTPLINKINMDSKKAYYMGNRENGHKVSLELTKGNYFIFVTDSHSWGNSTKYNQNGEASYITIGLDNRNGNCSLVNGYFTEPTATKLNSNLYISQYTYSQIYKCELTDDDQVTFITNDGNYSDCSQSIILESIKID